MKYKVIIKKFCIMTVAMSLSLCTISTSAYAGRNDKKANVGAEKNNNQNNNNKKNNNQNNNSQNSFNNPWNSLEDAYNFLSNTVNQVIGGNTSQQNTSQQNTNQQNASNTTLQNQQNTPDSGYSSTIGTGTSNTSTQVTTPQNSTTGIEMNAGDAYYQQNQEIINNSYSNITNGTSYTDVEDSSNQTTGSIDSDEVVGNEYSEGLIDTTESSDEEMVDVMEEDSTEKVLTGSASENDFAGDKVVKTDVDIFYQLKDYIWVVVVLAGAAAIVVLSNRSKKSDRSLLDGMVLNAPSDSKTTNKKDEIKIARATHTKQIEEIVNETKIEQEKCKLKEKFVKDNGDNEKKEAGNIDFTEEQYSEETKIEIVEQEKIKEQKSQKSKTEKKYKRGKAYRKAKKKLKKVSKEIANKSNRKLKSLRSEGFDDMVDFEIEVS